MAQAGFTSVPASFKQEIVNCNTRSIIEVISPNSFRESFIITNIGDTALYINYGPVCSDLIYICKLKPQAFMSDDFAGVVSCYSADGIGYALVTEKE